ncbi:hypothetical protein H8R18_01065 [Nanchangia anserum]|uniref:Uncharacterized protein n=1 Tax=Nanchangia anserum TaxID=2692125 RepID=A0A8I0KUL4_9ACTO|nr:hypothetical protein [Nanchangia anserum]MBD3689828.1 hypothetical protein [Nanchangia anserum]QOX81998.1 hypothetical protein H8R18_01065 [Nanchangia anserum]
MVLDEHDLYEDLCDWGGAIGDLTLFVWPHLTPERRKELTEELEWYPWNMVEPMLELCPAEVAVPERILTGLEEEATEQKREAGVYGLEALGAIKRHRARHASRQS